MKFSIVYKNGQPVEQRLRFEGILTVKQSCFETKYFLARQIRYRVTKT